MIVPANPRANHLHLSDATTLEITVSTEKIVFGSNLFANHLHLSDDRPPKIIGSIETIVVGANPNANILRLRGKVIQKYDTMY